MYWDVVSTSEPDRPRHQHPGAGGSEFQHLFKGNLVEFGGVRDNPRIGGEYAVDVGVDLAHLSAEGRRQGNRGGVGPAPAQSRDIAGFWGEPLEASNDDDLAFFKAFPNTVPANTDDLSMAVILSILGLAVASTALAYVIYFRLLATAGAVNAALVTFLIPVSAILLGSLVLGERLAAAVGDDRAPEAIGRVLLAVVELARLERVNSELALREATARAAVRFRSSEAGDGSDNRWVAG